MKKIFIILATALAAFTFISCEKNEVEPTGNTIKVNISVANPEGPDTKAVKTGWANGDKINIWFDNNYATTPDLVLTYDEAETKWVNGALKDGVTLNATGTFKAVFEGLNNLSEYTANANSGFITFNRDNNAIPLVFCTQEGSNLPTYTYNSGVLSGSITKWQTHTPFQVVVAGLNGTNASNYQLKCDQLMNITSFSVATNNIGRGTQAYNYYEGGVSNADGVAFSFASLANSGTSADYTFTLKDISANTEKTFTVTGKSLTQSIYKIQSIKISKDKFSTLATFVKDGLTYSVKSNKAILEKCNYLGGSKLYAGSIVIPDKVSFDGVEYPVTTIGDHAFENCTSLTSVTIPEGIKYIDAYAFVKTGLTTLSLPASLDYIDDGNPVFNNSSSLSSITVASGNTKFIVDNDILYYKKTSTSYMVMFVPESMTGDIVLNANTTSIAGNGTLYNTQASSIEFPAGFNEKIWGQFRGTITDGLELKFNYATADTFTTVFGSSMNDYCFGESNCTKIVVSFPSTLSDADLASLKTWFGGEGSLKVNEVKRRS